MAQALVSRIGSGFELRHLSDRSVPANTLRTVPVTQLRELARMTESGVFRPLKSAPSLRTGWRAIAHSEEELGVALNHLYPGALADWYAARTPQAPVTNYREFTKRQSGMYRITQLLTDQQAAAVIQACCDAHHCLKRRLWTVAGLHSDASHSKSIIPCLEPCAILLESARSAVRADQADQRQQSILSQNESS